MAAFNASTMYAINQNISTLYRRLKAVSTKKLTYDDFLNLFVAAEHRTMFKTIGPLLYTSYHNSALVVWPDNTGLTFTLHDNQRVPMPRRLSMQPDVPPELVQSITDWIERGGNASREAGRVRVVVAQLNAMCTRQEMRYFWPSILPLLTFNESNSMCCEIAKQLADVKVPKNPPPISPGLRIALRKATETVAVMNLLPADIEDKAAGTEVTVTVAEGGTYEEPGLGSYTGMSG